jgi:hypothetical protein
VRAASTIATVALGALVAVTLGSGCSSNKKNASADVTITRCDADPSGGRPTADGQITNHSSKSSAYAFRVTFTDSSGNKVSDGAASVGKVDAGGTATWHADGVANANGPLTCKATNVVRTAVP